jgi:hypothetical protein
MNLRLPLCPKCYDTKPVEYGTQMLGVFAKQYSCSECNITWWSPEKELIADIITAKGTIMDEQHEWHTFW